MPIILNRAYHKRLSVPYIAEATFSRPTTTGVFFIINEFQLINIVNIINIDNIDHFSILHDQGLSFANAGLL